MDMINNFMINDPLAVIYNEGLWRISKVSALYNLQSDTVKLKQYASKIRQYIVITVPTSTTTRFKVHFETQPYLKYSQDDPSGLMITVSCSQKNISKVIYRGILLSWGMNTKVENAVHLPYLLEHGQLRIGKSVKATLQKMFDCNIKQFCFSQYQLLQFGFNFVENPTSRSTDLFTFSYITKSDHKNKLNLKFEVGDVQIIWNGIKEELSNTSEQVKLAYQVLQNQIFYSVTLDVIAMHLCEVKLSTAEVKSNGRIKMKTPEIVNCVFTVLNEIMNSQIVDINETVCKL